MFHLVNLALSKFSEKWKGSRTKGLINKPELIRSENGRLFSPWVLLDAVH